MDLKEIAIGIGIVLAALIIWDLFVAALLGITPSGTV